MGHTLRPTASVSCVSPGAAAINSHPQSSGHSSECASDPRKAAEHLSACGITAWLHVQAGVHTVWVLQQWLDSELHSGGLGVKTQSALL